MTTLYTPTSVANYNQTPPPDDGTAVSANKAKWSDVKTKLGDPINTAVAAIDSNLTTAFAGINTAFGTPGALGVAGAHVASDGTNTVYKSGAWQVIDTMTFAGESTVLLFHDGIDNAGASFISGWEYELRLDAVVAAADASVAMEYYRPSAYKTTLYGNRGLSGATGLTAVSATAIYTGTTCFICHCDTNGQGGTSTSTLLNMGDAIYPARVNTFHYSYNTTTYAGDLVQVRSDSDYSSNAAVEHVKIYPSSGTLDSGLLIWSRRFVGP